MCRKEGQERLEGKKTNKEKLSRLECPSACTYAYGYGQRVLSFPTGTAGDRMSDVS